MIWNVPAQPVRQENKGEFFLLLTFILFRPSPDCMMTSHTNSNASLIHKLLQGYTIGKKQQWLILAEIGRCWMIIVVWTACSWFCLCLRLRSGIALTCSIKITEWPFLILGSVKPFMFCRRTPWPSSGDKDWFCLSQNLTSLCLWPPPSTFLISFISCRDNKLLDSANWMTVEQYFSMDTQQKAKSTLKLVS